MRLFVLFIAPMVFLLLGLVIGRQIERLERKPTRTVDMSNEFLRELAKYGKQLQNITQLTKIGYRTIHDQPVPNTPEGRTPVTQVEDLIRLAQRAAKIEAGGVP